jgi:SAM-dependent methyltransferase
MEPGPDGHFDERVASTYDEIPEPMVDGTPVAEAVKVLRDLAGGGRVLEFAIGTGRVGLPLAALRVDLSGIELSQAMLARLRAKPRGSDIPVVVGDMTSARAEGEFSLVYLVFNTIMNVTTQAGQVEVFRNAAAHLAPGGRFLIECGVPDLRRLPYGQTAVVFDRTADHVGVDEYDVANQGLVSHHLQRTEGGAYRRSSGPFRYVWPSELDLMARIAGMRLRERWAGWKREPFTSESTKHVSVWERAAPTRT